VKIDPQKLLEERIPGFGPASITELLFCVDPENFAVFNKRPKLLIKSLGYGDFDREKFSLKTYERFKEAETRIYQDFKGVKEAIERELGISIPKYDFVDGLATLVYDKKEPLTLEQLKDLKRQLVVELDLDEEVFNRALWSFQAAIDQYFHWLEKGDSEDVAIEKASIYAVGMLTASGITGDSEKRQTFILISETLKKLSESMVNLLREYH